MFVLYNPTNTFKFPMGIIEADIMIAPKSQSTSATTRSHYGGRYKESLDPHLVKGCLEMDFLDSFIGDSDPFLNKEMFILPLSYQRSKI